MKWAYNFECSCLEETEQNSFFYSCSTTKDRPPPPSPDLRGSYFFSAENVHLLKKQNIYEPPNQGLWGGVPGP